MPMERGKLTDIYIYHHRFTQIFPLPLSSSTLLLSLHSFSLSASHQSYLWLYFLNLTVGQYQHSQQPQTREGSCTNMAQIVASQLQQPCTVRDTSGNMLKALATAVHQVSMVITNAPVGTQLCALNRQEFGEIKGRKAKVKEEETRRHISLTPTGRGSDC